MTERCARCGNERELNYVTIELEREPPFAPLRGRLRDRRLRPFVETVLGILCDPCWDKAPLNYEALRDQYNSLLDHGMSRGDASSLIIAHIQAALAGRVSQ